jgi:predicted ATPase
MLVGTYRPEDITGEGGVHPLTETLRTMDREDLHKQIRLQRLPEDSIPEFLSYLLGRTEFTDEFRSRIYKETDGNPLFIIQLIKYMVEEKIIIDDDGVWKLSREVDKIDIPSKVYNVIARRLDRLDKSYRKVLDYAAVVGDTFTSSILADSIEMEKVVVLESLKDLEKSHKLIHTLNGKFQFDHEKIKDVLYNEIPEELRIEYHSIVARTIEEKNIDDLDDHVGELAYHYSQCNNKPKAVLYFKKAAELAKGSYSNAEAVRFYNEVLKLEVDNDKRSGIYEALGDIYFLLRDYERSKEAYSNASRLVSGARKSGILAKLGGILERKGDYDRALKLCTNALELVKGTNTAEEALAYQNIGNVHLFTKNFKNALESYERSLKISERLGDDSGIAACQNNIGLVFYNQGEFQNALTHLASSLKIRTRIGDQDGIASTLNNIGAAYQMMGNLEEAKKYLSRSEDIRARITDMGDTGSTSFLTT